MDSLYLKSGFTFVVHIKMLSYHCKVDLSDLNPQHAFYISQ